jgi:hypothetical protein
MNPLGLGTLISRRLLPPPSCEFPQSQREHPLLLLQKSLYVEKRSDERKRLQYCDRQSFKTARGGESPWSIVCTR